MIENEFYIHINTASWWSADSNRILATNGKFKYITFSN